jgi:nitroreductase
MTKFEVLKEIIHNRRSTKPAALNGQKIADADLRELLQLADWAPTHARTEPWRFIIYSSTAVNAFCADHAELYKKHTAADKFTQAKFDSLKHNGDKASHIVVVYMKRLETSKIPVLEEIAAVAAATQNILLGAAAKGIAVLWSTGGMTHHVSMKQYLELEEHDIVMGLLYLGYSDEPQQPGSRAVPFEAKLQWKNGELK